MATTQEQKDNNSKAHELKAKVNYWVDSTFNYIRLEVYEKCLDNQLFDSIRPTPITDLAEDYLDSISGLIKKELIDSYEEEIGHSDPSEVELLEFLVEFKEDEVRDYLSYEVNYPVWNTIFEFKNVPTERWLDKAQSVGFGVIEETEFFNASLFSTSAGHSFYSSYWIPLYLSIFENERKKYRNVNFHMV